MRIVLVVACDSAPKGVRLEKQVSFPQENLALAYLSSAVKKDGHAVTIIDGYSSQLRPEEVASRISLLPESPDIIGLSVLQSTASESRQLVHILRNQYHYDGRIVLGGWGVTHGGIEVLNYFSGVDAIFIGESEEAFRDYCNCENLKGDYIQIGAHSSRKTNDLSNSCIIIEPGFADLDALYQPNHYLYDGKRIKAPAPIQASRGCPWGRCSFCSTASAYGHDQWRFRKISSIVDEARSLYSDCGVIDFFFVDDCFFNGSEYSKNRAVDLAKRINEHIPYFEFSIDFRVPDFDRTVISKLKNYGLKSVFLGIESASETMLRRFRKGYSANKILPTVSSLKALDVDIIPGFILFDPWVTKEELQYNVDFLLNKIGYFDPTKLLKRLVPEYGTQIFNRIQSEGLLVGKYPSYSFKFSNPEIGELYASLQSSLKPVIDEYKNSCELPDSNGNNSDAVEHIVSRALKIWDQHISI